MDRRSVQMARGVYTPESTKNLSSNFKKSIAGTALYICFKHDHAGTSVEKPNFVQKFEFSVESEFEKQSDVGY